MDKLEPRNAHEEWAKPQGTEFCHASSVLGIYTDRIIWNKSLTKRPE